MVVVEVVVVVVVAVVAVAVAGDQTMHQAMAITLKVPVVTAVQVT